MDASHRGALCGLRRAPRSCIPGWATSNGAALLHELRFARTGRRPGKRKLIVPRAHPSSLVRAVLKRRAPTARAAPESGEADTIGFPYTYAFASYKIDELATWVTTNLKLGTINCPTVFNRDAYIALPVQYRQLLEDLRFGAVG